MKEILNKSIVLVLSRNWQAIDAVTPVEVFGQLANDSATGLDIQGEDWMVPVKWEDWLALPVREEDFRIGTARGPVRVPTVMGLSLLCLMVEIWISGGALRIMLRALEDRT